MKAATLLSLALVACTHPALLAKPSAVVQLSGAECEPTNLIPREGVCAPDKVAFTCATYLVNYYAAPPAGYPTQCFVVWVEQKDAQTFEGEHPFSSSPNVYCNGRH